MTRRILLVALALCVSGWGLRAAERATFVLADGQRVSGTLDPRGSSGDAEFKMLIATRTSRTFPVGEVSVIEFAEGSARPNELAAVPGRGHMLAMRNGGLRMGRLIGIVNGDTVVWQEEGDTRPSNLPIRQIARVYLNPGNAQKINGFGRGRRAGSYRQGYASGRTLASDVQILGNQPWTDTGVDVTRGSVLRFDDQGGVSFIGGVNNNTANAGGKSEIKSGRYPVPSAGVGALIGRVGTRGRPFLIGAGNGSVTMPASGRLYLGVNDDDFSDNAGAFTVAITEGR